MNKKEAGVGKTPDMVISEHVLQAILKEVKAAGLLIYQGAVITTSRLVVFAGAVVAIVCSFLFSELEWIQSFLIELAAGIIFFLSIPLTLHWIHTKKVLTTWILVIAGVGALVGSWFAQQNTLYPPLDSHLLEIGVGLIILVALDIGFEKWVSQKEDALAKAIVEGEIEKIAKRHVLSTSSTANSPSRMENRRS